MIKQIAGILIGVTIVFSAQSRNIETERSKADFYNRYSTSLPAGLAALLDSDTVAEKEKEALRFLYAYMTLPDIAQRSPQFFLRNIRASLSAVDSMHWGRNVPDREFRHFVLPVRVNNEDLDFSRPEFFKELKDRVKGLSMKDAVLEVNHWCHEKATYAPSDGRTNSPLATMCSALGRCGEESVFCVAALRSVGIPARQIYTPRWAHTDDNHAWVEAWADGKWYFLGACEPEPVLDLGWFNAPASRGIMMNTKVAGAYDGPEEVMEKNSAYTVINVTQNYAPVDEVKVIVKDTEGRIVEGAEVKFCIYNYAEFFPVCTKTADENGMVSLVAGRGDLVAWATDGKRFGFSPVNAGKVNQIELSYFSGTEAETEFNIVPPPVRVNMPVLTDLQISVNNRRKAFEDSVRMAYTSTFFTPLQADSLASKLGIDADALKPIMERSRGNHKLITTFLSRLPKESVPKAMTLLTAVSEKDLNDITLETLRDHIRAIEIETPLYNDWILNPRVATEQLTPYRSMFTTAFSTERQKAFREDPLKWAEWVRSNISEDKEWNPLNFVMTPQGVFRARKGDTRSIGVFFVAGARSFGIPARIDQVTGKVQYADASGEWLDIDPVGVASVSEAGNGHSGCINLQLDRDNIGNEPKYYSQFSIAKISDGLPRTLDYGEFTPYSDLDLPLSVEAGEYMLVTGRRMADGSVLVKVNLFPVSAGVQKDVVLDVRHADNGDVEVIGSFDSETPYLASDGEMRSLLSTTGRGYYIVGLIAPGEEPSAHALNDLSAVASELEKWGKKIVVLLPEESAGRFDKSRFSHLPANLSIGIDAGGKVLKNLKEGLNLADKELPVFVIADTFNRVVFMSQGYTIGLGEKLLDTLSRLTE